MKKTNPDVIKDKSDTQFEEINRWERHIETMLWAVYSVFITLNALAIKSFLDTGNLECKKTIYLFLSGGLVVIWGVVCWFAFRLIKKSLKLKEGIGQLKNYKDFLTYFDDSGSGQIFKTPWSWVCLVVTSFFILIWITVFIDLITR